MHYSAILCGEVESMTFQSRKRKTVTRSFRINEDWDRVLQEEANREGISVNALVNKLLMKYSLFQRFADRYDTLVIPKSHFSPILEEVSEEGLAQTARILGSTAPTDTFLMMGRPSNFDTISWFIEELIGDPFGRWFKSDHHVKGNRHIFHLRHDLGKKWSIFIANYITSMFKSILGVEVKSVILKQTVTITVEDRTLVI